MKKYSLLYGLPLSSVAKASSYNSFHENTFLFLTKLSDFIYLNARSNKFIREFLYFAHWTRKSNVNKLADQFASAQIKVGRGLSLHIGPSNVPVNSLFTLAFSILSGSPSILRIPSKFVDEFSDFFRDFSDWSGLPPDLIPISIITYPPDSDLSAILSRRSFSRVIWGNDRTCKYFKSLQTPLKCTDLYFHNRSSASIINVNSLRTLNLPQLDDLARKFSLDIFTFNQQACSSPKVLFVYFPVSSDGLLPLLTKFFALISQHAQSISSFSDSSAVDKFKRLSDLACSFNGFKLVLDSQYLSAFSVDQSIRVSSSQLQSGVLLYQPISQLSDLALHLDSSFQTLIHYGLTSNEMLSVTDTCIRCGVDRLVQPGQALNISNVWDGYDIIPMLSRTISN